MSEDNKSRYAAVWDRYVTHAFPELQSKPAKVRAKNQPWRVLNETDSEYPWPGDEWGDRATASTLLHDTFLSAFSESPKVLCELGAGAGRYTTLVYDALPEATVFSFDVSPEFERVLRERFEPRVESGSLRPFLLNDQPSQIRNVIKSADMLRRIDGVYSFDAMPHVDLSTLLVYWANAAMVLKPGGIMAMSVADACNENGFLKLLFDAGATYRLTGNAGMQFMWISEEIVQQCLSRLGFEVTIKPGNGRDLFFQATLNDPDAAGQWLAQADARWL